MHQNSGRIQRGSRSGRPWRGRGRGDDSWRGTPTSRGSKVHTLPKRTMEHIASVSRSSGLEADGDTLKDWKVQEEYRDFLQKKVVDLLVKNATNDAQANLLILFRKLREGIYSSNRKDQFALEVYETSFYLSTLFSSSLQSTSIISHLLPSLYISTSNHTNLQITTVLALLHHLVEGYPSQKSYYQLLSTLTDASLRELADFLPTNSKHINWIRSIAGSLRTCNYAQFERETRKEVIENLFPSSLEEKLGKISISDPPDEATLTASLPTRSLLALTSRLRLKSRSTTWSIIRTAYRELTLLPSTDTRIWLEQSLCLKGVEAEEMSASEWLEEQIQKGGTRRKEVDGQVVEGRWIVFKVR